MELMSAEEVDETVAFAKRLLERLEHEPGLADELIASIDERVLTEQPEESPKQRYERLFQSNGSALHR